MLTNYQHVGMSSDVYHTPKHICYVGKIIT